MKVSLKIKEVMAVSEKIKKARLYCITTPPKNGHSYEEMAEQACRGGADVLQLREKNLSAKELLLLAKKVREICHHYETLFIVNDRIDIALAAGADGVHLGQEDLPLLEARKFVSSYLTASRFPLPAGFLIGCSTHSLEQALAAERGGADYVGCGPIFATPTKPDLQPVGLNLIREYRKHLQIPFVAIGGIEEKNLREVIEAGAKCVAVVRAVCGSENVEAASRGMKAQIELFKSSL